MKSKEWKIPYSRPSVPAELIEAGYNPLLSAVLALRGISTAEQAHKLISGSEACLHDPMLISGMAQARERILKAIESKETVAVYGDYDVDGITSTCLVTDYLRSKGLECIPYIPDRNNEGYGLNCGAIELLHQQGVSLLITVDCGITAVEEAVFARSLGMDMIITDHHECKAGALPEAVAVIDCKQDGDNYPNKDLAGVGVAMKLICACHGDTEYVLQNYADLVAVGTVADVMPLVDENRYLVRRGLEKLSKTPRAGIAAMFKESHIDKNKLTASTIGFSLAPRLNAAGRLGQAVMAADLLMCPDEDSASALAAELCQLNRRRQDIEMEIWQEANSLISDIEPDTPIVLASSQWHQGVIGIAASRLAEQYSLPAIMICLSDEKGKGSCRSYGGFNLFEALSACSEHLMGFGGHALAAGLTIKPDKLDDFRKALTRYYRSNKPVAHPEIHCDILINKGSLLTIDNVRSLDLLEPYGSENPKPLMCMSGVRLESARPVGGGKHLKLRVRLGKFRYECIFFSHSATELGIREGDYIDLAFTPQINEFRGNVSVQLLVSAVRAHRPMELCDSILQGDEGALWAAAPFCPDRADFVKVWRMISRGFVVGEDTATVLRQCPRNMEPERFCLCLMVLLETGLLRSSHGSIFGAYSAKIKGKADLEATRIIQTLRSM